LDEEVDQRTPYKISNFDNNRRRYQRRIGENWSREGQNIDQFVNVFEPSWHQHNSISRFNKQEVSRAEKHRSSLLDKIVMAFSPIIIGAGLTFAVAG